MRDVLSPWPVRCLRDPPRLSVGRSAFVPAAARDDGSSDVIGVVVYREEEGGGPKVEVLFNIVSSMTGSD